MEYKAGKQFQGMMGKIMTFLNNEKPKIAAMLEDVQLTIGKANESSFGVPAHAKFQPAAMGVGDASVWKGDLIGMTDEIKTLSKVNPEKVGLLPKFNTKTNKYDFYISKRGIGDSIITGQQISPWNISFFSDIAKKPLSYSHADKLIKRYPGSNPWATVMTLLLQDYAGAASIGNAGSVSNNMNQDVQVLATEMTNVIINAICSYSITIEELERSKNPENPFAGKMITEKEKYVDYCLKLIRDYLIYYGDDASDTLGLLGINSVTSWGGTSLSDVNADGANVTKGSTVYAAFATALRAFIGAVDNKFNKVVISMSPLAYNLLATLVYSNTYNPTTAMQIIKQNLETDMTKDGQKLKIEIYADPMLKASSVFNSNVYDYLIFTAPEILAGADEERQDLLWFGEPIDNFTFPVVPGMDNTQYKKLKRMAGVFAPCTQAVQAYYGFGIDA